MGDWEKNKGDVALVEGSVGEGDGDKAGSDGGGATTAFTIVENNGGDTVQVRRGQTYKPRFPTEKILPVLRV